MEIPLTWHAGSPQFPQYHTEVITATVQAPRTSHVLDTQKKELGQQSQVFCLAEEL